MSLFSKYRIEKYTRAGRTVYYMRERIFWPVYMRIWGGFGDSYRTTIEDAFEWLKELNGIKSEIIS